MACDLAERRRCRRVLLTAAHLELVVHLHQPVYEDCAHVLVDVGLRGAYTVSLWRCAACIVLTEMLPGWGRSSCVRLEAHLCQQLCITSAQKMHPRQYVPRILQHCNEWLPRWRAPGGTCSQGRGGSCPRCVCRRRRCRGRRLRLPGGPPWSLASMSGTAGASRASSRSLRGTMASLRLCSSAVRLLPLGARAAAGLSRTALAAAGAALLSSLACKPCFCLCTL